MIKPRKKILVITTRFPFEYDGACPQDRAHGIKLLTEMNYDVVVITMCYERHLKLIKETQEKFNIKIVPIVYESHNGSGKTLLRKIIQITNPLNWDGSAFEFTRSEIKSIVRKQLEEVKPNLVWCDYSYMWRLYSLIKNKNIPIITRSLNYEPNHFFMRPHEYHNQKRLRIIKWLQFKSKIWSEEKMLKYSDHVYSITPKEKFLYESLNSATSVTTLPLRRLGQLMGKYEKPISTQSEYNIFYMGANYKVAHMRQALYFLLDKVNPILQKKFPNQFKINLTGGKMPEDVIAKIADGTYQNVEYHGFVDDMDEFLNQMDIAISPSLSGEGMQQKIFEALVRGIPTITNERGLVGYPFYNNIHYLAVVASAESYVNALAKMTDTALRQKLAKNSVALSQQLFSEEIIKNIIQDGINKVTS